MRKRSRKKPISRRTRPVYQIELRRMPPSPIPAAANDLTNQNGGSLAAAAAEAGKSAKKKPGARLWMRFDRTGQSEILECDKNAIIKRTGIPARDLRMFGPVFSHSSNILAREKAIVVSLEFIKAIVTAEEVLVLDPLSQEVLPFVDHLRQQLPLKSPARIYESGHAVKQTKEMRSTGGQWLHIDEAPESEIELPFEFQVLEIALEVVCSYLDSNASDLERVAYPVLDELALKVTTKNLERVRSLKNNLTHLLARVQKV